MAHLSSIHIYPIKSCGGVSLDEVTMTALGLAGDRRWQVVDEEGAPVTQRLHKILATVRPEPIDGGLRIGASSRATIEVARPSGPASTALSMFATPVPAADAGDDAAGWFSDLVGADVRLVAMTTEEGWRLPSEMDVIGQPAAFSDAAPVLVTTTASLEWLQNRATEPFGMDRFRPNLVIDGTDPWAEDTWDTFSIGAAAMRAALPWPRCTIPQIDQDTAERHKEPAKVLKQHRWLTSAPQLPDALRTMLEGNTVFGVACSVGPAGAVVAVGDELSLEMSQAPILPMQ